MPTLTDQQLADALLTIAAAVPSDVPWNFVAIHGLGVVLAWDKRADADTAILEAILGEHGPIVASSVDHVTVEGGTMVGAMIRPEGDLEEAAGTLRMIYPIATAPDEVDTDPDPF